MNKFLALLFTVSFSFAQFRDIPEVVTKVATSTANWLKLETSARAIGMGVLMLLQVEVYLVFHITLLVLHSLKVVRHIFHRLIILQVSSMVFLAMDVKWVHPIMLDFIYSI